MMVISLVVKSLSEAMVKLKKQKLQDKKSTKSKPSGNKNNKSSPSKGKPNIVKPRADMKKGKDMKKVKGNNRLPAENTQGITGSEKKRVRDEENKGAEKGTNHQLKKQRQSVKPNFHLVGIRYSILHIP